jgi:hypothetical protein
MGNPALAIESADSPSNRSKRDRRLRPTPMFSLYSFRGGRRAAPRRVEENEGAYVDYYGPGLFLTVTAIALLNFLDAFFTILYLSYGGRELNPVVQHSLDWGIPWFIALKSVGIGICLIFLTVTKNSQFSRFGLALIFTGYLALTCWHAVLYVGLAALGLV